MSQPSEAPRRSSSLSALRPRPDWLRIGFVSCLVSWALSVGCTQVAEPPPLSSLRRSGQATFVCIAPDGHGAPLTSCPQGARLTDGGLMVGKPGHQLHSLVTQTASAEVAVVRLTGAESDGTTNGRVLDADSTNPGVTPLRVGQQPVDIVTTPGGMASFVGVAETGRTGIFALSTSCIFEPAPGETKRDLTTWPACSLSSAPGEMVMVVDRADTSGQIRESCGGSLQPAADLLGKSGQGECSADLAEEDFEPGRRKLVVALPEEGKLVVIDAQELLDREQGSFGACKFEAELPLSVNLPSRIQQPLPGDLVKSGCTEPLKEYGPFVGPFEPRPSGLAERDGLLVVGDQGAPVVHRVDLTNVCAPVEIDPLIATSFLQPSRVVTTSRVALSPPSIDGARYVYAIDEVGERVASVMVFDVSPNSTSRTPLVRAGSPDMLLEPPDRLEYAAPAKDVAFVLSDRPEIDQVTGTGSFGVRCDPDPSVDSTTPEGRYRPNLEDETGAQPRHFRGLFGYVLLGNANLAVVDIDDYDSACRRPIRANSSSTPDFRGCQDDPPRPPYYTLTSEPSGTPTVTGESSCHVVEPHRARSGNLMVTDEDTSARSPSLTSFARLNRLGRGLPVSRLVPAGRQSPILLGVDFEAPGSENEPAQVHVGNQLYTRGDLTSPLIISPRFAEQASVVLPQGQPRAYPSSEVVTVTFEGELSGLRPTGLFDEDEGRMRDSQARFCDSGVQSQSLTEEVGRERFRLDGEVAAQFGRNYADYVQVVNRVRAEDDPYWDGDGKVCGSLSRDPTADSFTACDALFGDGVITTATTTQTTQTTTTTNTSASTVPTTPGSTIPGRVPTTRTTTTRSTTTTYTTTTGDDLMPTRDFRIVEAYQDYLELEPRSATGAEADEIVAMLACCFPDVISYKVRAGKQWVVRGEVTGFRHAVRAEAVTVDGATQYQCVRDCDPLRGEEQGRAFEISSTDCADPNPNIEGFCAVGPRTDEDLVCAYNTGNGRPVEPGGVASECIFDAPNRRFAMYRGLAPSQRGMSFGFEVQGGFSPMVVPLTDTSITTVLPVSLTPVPTFGGMAVVDSQSRGLMMIDLQAAAVTDTFF
ncbi:MAG TPA: hypothetical protein VLC09_14425 [Polyangiaceae bacterium]|nr:hypothetical protein [Polyangiaceae bacterium]